MYVQPVALCMIVLQLTHAAGLTSCYVLASLLHGMIAQSIQDTSRQQLDNSRRLH